MYLQVIKDALASLQIQVDQIDQLPFGISLDDRLDLLAYMTDFEQVGCAVVINNNGPVTWQTSDVVEFYLDDQTQYFLHDYQVTFCTTSRALALSMTYAQTQINTVELADFINRSVEKLDTFIIEYTAI